MEQRPTLGLDTVSFLDMERYSDSYRLASGDYKVVATDATQVLQIDSLEITIATLPSISIVNTSTDVTCFGDDDGELTFEIYGGNPSRRITVHLLCRLLGIDGASHWRCT